MTDAPQPFGNPAGWPDEVLPIFQRAITCQVGTVTRQGAPVTLPLTPYLGATGHTLDVSTGLTYPAKAERVRRHPRVGMLFADPVGSGLANPPVVLVYGLGAVHDRDLQANADRYLRLSRVKLPGLYGQLPWFVVRRQRWYWTRMWIHITPIRILWWPGGDLDALPRRWDAPLGTAPEPSDPAPPGKQPPPWKPASDQWRPRAAYALRRLGLPTLTVTDEEGFPVPFCIRRATLAADGFALDLPAHRPAPVRGPACLSFHEHDERFSREENATFAGSVESRNDGQVDFHVARVLGDLSAPGFWPRRVWSVLATRRRLQSRLRAEVARRGQPVPTIRL
jgi:hypothetical protein